MGVISAVVDHCQPGMCANGATCVSQDNTYICICPPKYQGRNCDKGNASNYKPELTQPDTSQLSLTVPLVTRQKPFHRLFMAVSIRTEVVSTSVQRLQSRSFSVTVLQATAWQLTTEAVCHKVGFGIIFNMKMCFLYSLTSSFSSFIPDNFFP